MGTVAVRIAEVIMRNSQTERPSWSNGAELNEIIHHPKFIAASEQEQADMLMRSAQAKYSSEMRYAWDHYFGIELKTLLTGRRALDLGSLYGGRTVAWAERYQLAHITGIDVNPLYVDAATRFAQSRNAHADFVLGCGEGLPFEDNSFEAILSFDVLEHVQSPELTLRECFRVLKRGGYLCIVFPSYWQPIEHHLSLVTRAPGLQYLFSGSTLISAYNRILASRGDDASWYRRSHLELREWERCNTINGLTLARFRGLVGEIGFGIVRHSRPPIGSIGRTVAERPSSWHRALAAVGRVMVRVPVLEEGFLHRNVFILERRREVDDATREEHTPRSRRA